MRRPFMTAAWALVLACGQPPSSGVTPRDRDVLTHAEIVSNGRDGFDLYEALQALRPHFLEAPPGVQRGSAPRGITVYVNDRRVGGVEALRSVTAGTVEEVRYMGPTESQQQFGQAATLVTLVVRLRRDPNPAVDRWTGGPGG